MKIIHICECCDQVVREETIMSNGAGEADSAALTEGDSGDIMNLIFQYCLCDECREMLYGPAEAFFYKGPVWLH
jgi:hypothetical protein